MSKNTVTIGSRLPHGVILEVTPAGAGKPKTHKVPGLNSAKIIGALHVSDEIDADFWAAWKVENPESRLLSSMALFDISRPADGAQMAAELRSEKTGFEPLEPNSMGVKAA